MKRKCILGLVSVLVLGSAGVTAWFWRPRSARCVVEEGQKAASDALQKIRGE